MADGACPAAPPQPARGSVSDAPRRRQRSRDWRREAVTGRDRTRPRATPAPRARCTGEHAQPGRRQVAGHCHAWRPRGCRVVAIVRHQRRDGVPAGQLNGQLQAAAEVDDIGQQPGHPVRPWRAGWLDADPLRADDDLGRAAVRDVAARTSTEKLSDSRTSLRARADGPRDRRVHQVGDAEEVGDERVGGLLVEILRRGGLLDPARG